MTDTVTRAALIEAIMGETTDDIVSAGGDHISNPNVLVQGCKYIRRSEPAGTQGYASPEEAALRFAGFIADRVLTMLAAAPKAEPVSDVMNDFACDSAYLAGMATGWNFGQDNDAEGYNNLKAQRTNQMVEARKEIRAQPEAQKGEPIGEIAKVIDFAGDPTEVVWADKMPPSGTKLYAQAAPYSEPLKAMLAAITKVAMIAEAWGDGAGEPSIEIAGGIVAYLAANPAEIETFLVNPSLEQSLAACRPENWCLTWRAQTGEIMDRVKLAEYLATHTGPQP